MLEERAIGQYEQRAGSPGKGNPRPGVQSLTENSDLDDQVVLTEA